MQANQPLLWTGLRAASSNLVVSVPARPQSVIRNAAAGVVMANGKPGDHPLNDLLVHGSSVYGKDADDLIRKIALLCSGEELREWWQREIGWGGTDLALSKARVQYDKLIARAKANGWEIPEGAA